MPHAADPSAAPPQTWLILGVDSRQTVPEGPNHYGTTSDVQGSRADIIAVAQPTEAGLTVLSIPRELTLRSKDGGIERLATSHLAGPQATVDLLCHGLGVTTTHLVTIDMAQFAGIVDSLGGVEVEIPEPVRDSYSGLSLPTAGTHRLDGVQALALVRSRHPEVLREGTWTALDEAEGHQRRAESVSSVMRALVASLAKDASRPWSAHQRAHSIAGNLTLDHGTGLMDLYSFARSATAARDGGALSLVSVPAPAQGNGLIAFSSDETRAVLAEHGYSPGSCEPAGS